jgi:hypothetical protein
MGSMLPVDCGLSGCGVAYCECTVQVLAGVVVAVSNTTEIVSIVFMPGLISL